MTSRRSGTAKVVPSTFAVLSWHVVPHCAREMEIGVAIPIGTMIPIGTGGHISAWSQIWTSAKIYGWICTRIDSE
ncbi:unnamed protein product [Caretta caretta]